MMKTNTVFKGIKGCVSDLSERYGKWDWCIEIFLGTIWDETQDFEKFVKELSRVWLHEYLHMVLNWERVHSHEEFDDGEETVRVLESVLGVE